MDIKYQKIKNNNNDENQSEVKLINEGKERQQARLQESSSPHSTAASPPSRVAAPPSRAAAPPSKEAPPETRAATALSREASTSSRAASPQSRTASSPSRATQPQSRVAAQPQSRVAAPPSREVASQSRVAAPPSRAATQPSRAASPPSASSSPSHEFSFTISLHPSSTIPAPPPFAIDLSPADEIFYHGHLLPLHLLSRPPISPRSSTNSSDSFSLPIKELLQPQNQNQNKLMITSNDHETEPRIKSKSFSLFGIQKWRKGCPIQETESEKHKKKLIKFDVVSHVLKRYIKMVRSPFLSIRNSNKNMDFQRQSYSFSGNLSFRDRTNERLRRAKRGEFSSAPASMWTSPTNSGHLVAATGTIPVNYSSNDSTMEELQAAIQSAIAHCKNSNSTEAK